MNKKNKILEEKVSQISAQILERDKTIENLTEKLDRSEQYSRRNNIRISGLPESDSEDTDDLVVQVAKSVGVDLSVNDIDISHHVPRRPVTPQDPPRQVCWSNVLGQSQRRWQDLLRWHPASAPTP